jgi:DNA-directed RNA polymerase specialized sigma24 family protein
LSPRDRNIVMMIVQGNSYQTAAQREGLSVGAVKLRLNRVRPFLRVSVGEAIGTAPAARAWRRPPRARLAA